MLCGYDWKFHILSYAERQSFKRTPTDKSTPSLFDVQPPYLLS